MDRAAVAEAIKQVRPQLPIVMLSEHLELPEKALQTVDAVVTKSDGPQFLLSALHSVLAVEPIPVPPGKSRTTTNSNETAVGADGEIMTSHQLGYVRYLLRRIKDLYIEKEAMSVLLDTASDLSALRTHHQWRESVERMRKDPVYCSAIEANLAPQFERMEQALQNESLLKKLQECR